MTPSPIDPILEAHRAGHQMLLLEGRSLADLHVDENGAIRPLHHALCRRMWQESGMVTLKVNLALGPCWVWEGIPAEARANHEKALSSSPLHHGIQAGGRHQDSPYERAFLLLASLKRSLEEGARMPPILLIWEFGEDLVPCEDRGPGGDFAVQIHELLQLMARDYRRRTQPLVFLLTGACERIDRRIAGVFHRLRLPQSCREEKLRFIAALRGSAVYQGACFEPGLDDMAVANLTASTPNTSLEAAFLGSARTRRPLSHLSLLESKRADVVALSEGTLSLLDTERVKEMRLAGRTIERPLELLRRWGQGLKQGDPLTPMNVILAGAPSSAKTDLALLTALESQTPAYSVLSPKGALVGQTERQVRLLFKVLKELSPAFGVIDEITEAFPTERHAMNLDSGSSSAVTAEMLHALSDSSRAGRTLLIATTNCPWRLGAAMASRFLYVPVLSAIEPDYPEILCAVAESLMPGAEWDPDDETIRGAASAFYAKGASPRVMRALVAAKMTFPGAKPGPGLLAWAAQACAPQDPRDRASAVYADLFAIRACSDLEMLPWHGRMSGYPLPDYLKGIVDESSGEVDPERLTRRIEELKPHVNV